MTLNAAIGVTVFLVGMALTASIAVNLFTQHMLRQCQKILDFCIDLAEQEELEAIKKEGTE